MQEKILHERQSSIELLRILSMQMIVFFHFSIYGGFSWGADTVTIPRLWYNFISMWGKVGVNIFVLISGYFLINDGENTFNIKKALKYIGQVFFYSVVIFIVFTAFGKSNTGIKSVFKTLFPITFSSWWFASTYFVLFLIHPFLNMLLCSLNKRVYQSLLLTAVILRSVIPTLTASTYLVKDLIWFIILYAIAGYIRRFGLNEKYTSRRYFCFFIIISVLTYGSSVVFSVLGTRWSKFANYSNYFYGQDRITILLISVSLFMVFSNMKMKYRKPINIIASASFGVYLIHDNELIRPFLWKTLLNSAQYQDSLSFIPYSIIAVEAVYVACTAIDLARQKVFERPYMKLVDRFSESLTKSFSKAFVFFRDLFL